MRRPFSAEMALATMNGLPVPGLDPPWTLTLSHTESLAETWPKGSVCAQFVKGGPTGIHALQATSAQQLFRIFRPIGPLVLIRTNVDVGYPQRTCVIQFWNEDDANCARIRPCPPLRHVISGMGSFTLRTFTWYSVLCSVSRLSL